MLRACFAFGGWVVFAAAAVGCAGEAAESQTAEAFLATQTSKWVAASMSGFSGENFDIAFHLETGRLSGEHVLRTPGCLRRAGIDEPVILDDDGRDAIAAALRETTVRVYAEAECEDRREDRDDDDGVVADGDFPSLQLGSQIFTTSAYACAVLEHGAVLTTLVDALDATAGGPQPVVRNGDDYEPVETCGE